MDWRVKSAILAASDFIPAAAYYRLTKRLLGSGGVNLAPGVPDAWDFHRDAIVRTGARTILEFGAGRHLGLNVFLSTLGIEQTVVDLDRIASLELVNDAIGQLAALGHLPDGTPVRSFDELRARFAIDYRAPCDVFSLPGDQQFDASTSSSVWEHIPAADIPRLLAKFRTLVRTDGHIIAHIDYSDHYSHSDPAIDRVHFLSIPERQWLRHNHRRLYQSRLRHADYARLFAEAGLEAISEETSTYVESPKEPCLPELLTGAPTDLATTGRWILRI